MSTDSRKARAQPTRALLQRMADDRRGAPAQVFLFLLTFLIWGAVRLMTDLHLVWVLAGWLASTLVVDLWFVRRRRARLGDRRD